MTLKHICKGTEYWKSSATIEEWTEGNYGLIMKNPFDLNMGHWMLPITHCPFCGIELKDRA